MDDIISSERGIDDDLSDLIKWSIIDDAIKLIDSQNFHDVAKRYNFPYIEKEKVTHIFPEIYGRLPGVILHGNDANNPSMEKSFSPHGKKMTFITMYDCINKCLMEYEANDIVNFVLLHLNAPEKPLITLEGFFSAIINKNRYIFGSAAIYLHDLINKIKTIPPNNIDAIDDSSYMEHIVPFDRNVIEIILNFDGRNKFVENACILLAKHNFGEIKLYEIEKAFFGEQNILYRKHQMKTKDLEDVDISVSRLIYDVEEKKFIYIDDRIREELKNRITEYKDQPFNYYLDRFGKRRMKTDALKRVLKYIEKGFRIKNKNVFFEADEIRKLIIDNEFLENNYAYTTSFVSTEDKFRYIYNKTKHYGLAKTNKLLRAKRHDAEFIMRDLESDTLTINDLRTIKFSEEMDIHKMKIILKKLFKYIDRCIDSDRYTITGSAVLACELPDDDSFVPNNVDVWVNLLPVEQLKSFINMMEEKFESRMVRDGMAYTIKIFNGTLDVQFTFSDDDSPYNILKKFDMEFCKICFIDNQIIKDDYVDKAINEKKSIYMPGRMQFKESENNLVLHDEAAERVNKYIKRGFELIFMGKSIVSGEDVVISNGVNENLEHFFITRDI